VRFGVLSAVNLVMMVLWAVSCGVMVWVPAVSIFWLEYKPLHLKFPH